jgi:hypothetical protein
MFTFSYYDCVLKLLLKLHETEFERENTDEQPLKRPTLVSRAGKGKRTGAARKRNK